MKPEKSKPIGIRVGNLSVLGIVMGTLLTLLAVLTGCPEGQNMMKPVITEPADTTPPVTVGEMKEPEEKPDPEPTEEETTEQTPEDTTPPTVVEVAWYSDEQLEQPIVDDVHPGDTVYTVVRFSEPMRHIVADDETVKPVLYIVIDGVTKRYRMRQHEADLKSREAKPLHGDTDYLCKYTIPADTVGTLALRIGSTTADTAGNRVTETLVHTAPFMVTEPEPEQITLTLPPGYTLPPELTPTEVTLSQDERMLADIDARVEDRDALAPHWYFTTDKPVDVISVLPYEYREEVYELFIASVDLPFFAEAAEVMKETDIKLIALGVEAHATGDWGPYVNYRFNIRNRKVGLHVVAVSPEILRDIYFEENPHLPYQASVSRYWFILEWYRIQLAHPEKDVNNEQHKYDLLDLYRESCRNDGILGFDNPWD